MLFAERGLGVVLLLLFELDATVPITAATIVAVAPISAIITASIVFETLRREGDLDLDIAAW